MWYVVIQDSRNRKKVILLAGPYDTQADADRACPIAANRYISEHDQWAVFGVHGVARISTSKAPVYGKI